MSQLGLLAWTPPKATPSASEQSRELARVESGIGALVLAFCRERWKGDRTFSEGDLVMYVLSRATGRAASSPARILRDLRDRGHVSYEATKASRYTLTRVEGEKP